MIQLIFALCLINLISSFSPIALSARPDSTFHPQLHDTTNNGQLVESDRLNIFLNDASKLGAVRFVVVGGGAILEAVGSFDNLRYADSPKSRLATISTDIPCFECHIRVNEVKEIRSIKIEKFGKLLRINRFIGFDNNTILSAILHEPSDQNIAQW